MPDPIKNQDLSSAPGTIDVSGRTFVVSRLNNMQAVAIGNWAMKAARAKANPLKDILDSLNGLEVSAQDRAEILKEAARSCVTGAVGPEQIASELLTPQGCGVALYHATREHHSAVSMEEILALITEENFAGVWVELDNLAGLGEWAKRRQ